MPLSVYETLILRATKSAKGYRISHTNWDFHFPADKKTLCSGISKKKQPEKIDSGC